MIRTSSSSSSPPPNPEIPVVAYVRSSKDLHDVSCEAQAERIRQAIPSGERLVHVFEDKALSSTRDDLPGLRALLTAAKADPPPFAKIYVLDTSRIARDTLQAQTLKHYLRKKRGIELTFLQLPQTGSYMDDVLEKMMEVWDELHSRMSKDKGVEGQRQNVRRGYRAGGEASYGYRRRIIVIGQHRNGQPITKSVNEPDPVTAPVIQEYFGRRARGESRSAILRDFERRGIASPKGSPQWSTSTARSFEENLPVYLGHLVYGRMNERLREGGMVGGKKRGFVGGQKRRPPDQWTVHEHAHPPLITPEIAEQVQARLRQIGVSERRGDAYVLSGILVCGLCGQHYVGSRSGGRYVYRCLSRSKRGQTACANNDIAREPLETFAIRLLKEELLNEERLADLVARLQRRPLVQQRRAVIHDTERLRRELDSIDHQLHKALELYTKSILDEGQLAALTARLRQRRTAIHRQLEAPGRRSLPVDFHVNADRLRAFLNDMETWMHDGDIVKRKMLLREVYHTIRLWPKVGKPWTRKILVSANVAALTRSFVVAPTGFEPVFSVRHALS